MVFSHQTCRVLIFPPQNRGSALPSGFSKVDTAIDFNWAEGLVTADSSDYASAQFDGYLQVPSAANYTFYITCDDGANLWIDDELVLSQATAGQYETRPILLTGSRLYHLQVMYYERTGFARMRLEWASDQGLVRAVIGKDSWYHSRSLLGLFPQSVLVFDKPGLYCFDGVVLDLSNNIPFILG